MEKYIVTNLSKDREAVCHELTKTVPLVFRGIKKNFSIEETKLLYTPFLMDSYEVEVRTLKRTLSRKFYMCTDLCMRRIKAYDTVNGLSFDKMELSNEAVINPPEEPLSQFQERARRDLVLRVLPRQLHSYRENPMRFLESRIFYRPLWLIRYRLFGKVHVYKTYGDLFNL